MSVKKQFLIMLTLATLGQGCFEISGSVQESEPTGVPSPEGFVAFREGFGAIPGPSPAPISPRGATAEVTWTKEIPFIPSDVTVIRQHKSTPSVAILQNLTTALDIPAGAIQARPTTDVLTLAWRDGVGYRWSYNARSNHVAFDRITKSTRLISPALPGDEAIIRLATSFLDDRGVKQKTGTPFLSFSWNVWWANEIKDNRCHSNETLARIRFIATQDPTIYPSLSVLPRRTEVATCQPPVYPTGHVVNFHKVQDEQDVFDASGRQVLAAQIVVNATDGTAESGWFEIEKDADRSNYPARSLEDVTNHLLLGGTNDVTQFGPGNRIVINEFSNSLYEHNVEVNGEERTYFIPAITAYGSVFRGGREESYSTVVPLLDLAEYAP